MLTTKVRTYLKWIRYVLDVSLRDKYYVVVNVDETGVSTMKASKPGYVTGGVRRRRHLHSYEHQWTDRSNVKTTFMGVICDQPHLQPHLPQVFLPKYTQNAAVPAALRTRYDRQGYPFQFWHRTNGTVTPAVFRLWARGLRSAVQSFNRDAWIVLVMDCHSSHLDLSTVEYLQRLGIICIVVPAALTWLLQPLDVYVYSEFKRSYRQNLEVAAASHVGHASQGSWLASVTKAARETIVNRDWGDEFDRLGFGIRPVGLRSQVYQYIGDVGLFPALPTSGEFAAMIHRLPGTENVMKLHRAFMRSAIRVSRLPHDALPDAARRHVIPDQPPSRRRGADAGGVVPSARRRMQSFLWGQVPHDGLGGLVGPASVQISMPHPLRV